MSAGELFAQDQEVISVTSTTWKASIFGDIGGDSSVITPNYFGITQLTDNSFNLRSSSNKGKIASSSEGIAYVYQELSKGKDFVMTAKAEVKSFEINNQVSFGIMVRDTVYENFGTKEGLGSYVSAGVLNITNDVPTASFFRTPDSKTSSIAKLESSPKPAAGAVYDIKVAKTGSTYTLTFGTDEKEFSEEIFSGDSIYVGIYTARNCEVTFTDVTLK